MKLVVDASVALKWYLAFRPNEQHIQEAAAVGEAILTGYAELIAPSHWSLEVIAVLARTEPHLVDQALLELESMRPKIIAQPHVVKRAAQLSVQLNHHLFDTLYHAVALETGAALVTADLSYFEKAKALGSITLLADFAI